MDICRRENNENNVLVYFCFKCHLEFIDCSDFRKHASQEFCTRMDDLTENCMDIIFNHLPLQYQITMSLTSKRYRDLFESYLYRKYEGPPVLIIARMDKLTHGPRSSKFWDESTDLYLPPGYKDR